METVFTTRRKPPASQAESTDEAGNVAPDEQSVGPTDGQADGQAAGKAEMPPARSPGAEDAAPPEPQAAALTLPERLDSRAAGALAEALLPCRDRAMILDASAVGFVGARCAEVLLAAQLASGEGGQKLAVATPSEAFVSGLEALGLAGLLAQAGAGGGNGGTT